MQINKFFLSVLMTGALVACGGGGDDSSDPGPGTGTAPETSPTVSTANYKNFVFTNLVANLGTPLAPDIVAPINAAGNINGVVTVGSLTGTLKPTADGGYVASGDFTRILTRSGAVQVCRGINNAFTKSQFVLVPPDAVAVPRSELVGKTLYIHEDCNQSLLDAKFTYNNDGSATLYEGSTGAGEAVSASAIADLFGSGHTEVQDGTSQTVTFRAFKRNGQYFVVEQGAPTSGVGGTGYVSLWAID